MITIGGWVGFLIGFSIGGVAGIIIGVIMTDKWWHKNATKFVPLITSSESNKREANMK